MPDNILINISIPLDNNFLRRECPFCKREFKIRIPEQEIKNLSQQILDSFLTDKDDVPEDAEENKPELMRCPYCSQQAIMNEWWTQEQLAYVRIFAENIVADIVNDKLIKPLRSMNSRSSNSILSLSFKGDDLKKEVPWISPENDDMKTVDLPCCESSVKIVNEWKTTVVCPFCGFIHSLEKQSTLH
jgi:uncharacterized Zn-finger protein